MDLHGFVLVSSSWQHTASLAELTHLCFCLFAQQRQQRQQQHVLGTHGMALFLSAVAHAQLVMDQKEVMMMIEGGGDGGAGAHNDAEAAAETEKTVTVAATEQHAVHCGEGPQKPQTRAETQKDRVAQRRTAPRRQHECGTMPYEVSQ